MIGLTYSTEHYETFSKTGDKNIFEDVIDKMIIEEVSGMNESFKRAISNLPKRDKRLAILSILDKDRNLFKSIKSLITENKLSKVDHLKDVIYKIREYVKVGEVEQRKYGEVMSDLDKVVKPMVNELPDDYWTNPNLKILDNCNGTGPFPLLVIWKLMNGLKDVIKNEEERYKHIIENMIYVAELQPKNQFIWMCIADPYDEYNLNVYTGSFLDSGFDRHMKEVWNVDRFQLILGNPPYQLMDGGAKASAKPLYNLFIEKSIKICDQLLYITPSRWFAGGKGLGPFRKMMMESNKIRLINHFDDATELFGKSVEIKGGVSYFLYDNLYTGNCTLNYNEVDLNRFDVIVSNFESIPIISKFMDKKSISTICHPRSYFKIEINDKRISDSKLNDNYSKCYLSKLKGFEKWIDREKVSKVSDKYRVVTPRAATKGGGGFGNLFISYPGEFLSDSYISFFVDTESEAVSLLSYLKTKFANFLLSTRKVSQSVKGDTCKWIPIVPFDRIWTDNDIFEYFNLNESERKLISKFNI